MKKCDKFCAGKRNIFLAAGCLLLAAANMLGEAGWIPHGLKLFLLGLAVALELYGIFRQCRGKEEQDE